VSSRSREGLLRRWAASALVLAGLAGCASGPSPRQVEQQNLLASGERLENSGAYDAALVEYVRALEVEPDNAETHYRVGRVHAVLGNGATARDAFLRALAKAPAHPGALEGLGLLYLEEGQRDAANSLLHKAVAKDPARWRAYNGLGVLADLAGKHALAQRYFGSALDLRPADATLMNNLGYSYYLDGRLREAQQQFERVVAADPKNTKARSNLGLVLTRQGQYPRAVQTMERIMSPAEARYSVGYICLIDGKLEEAERLFKESIRRSNSYDPAVHAALKRVREEQDRRARVGDEDE
jgi:Flp pilus assembly protein TadD